MDVATVSPRTDRTPDKIELDSIEFSQFCEEVRLQPGWRKEADKCADYYDGNQLDQETASDLEKKGMGPLIVNLVKPTIDVVLGMEAKTRSDWRVMADNDDWQETAEALSSKLNEAERESRADRACSDAYAQQVKSGIGWVEVTRESDPFKCPYRVRAIHRREIFWDWASKEPDLSDARYLIRQKWYPIAEAKAYMPEHAELIQQAGMGWPLEWLKRAAEDTSLTQAYNSEARLSLSDWEWRNIERHMVSLFECWYRRFQRGLILRLPDGRAVEFDKNNPMHVAGVARGVMKPEPAVYSKIRVSLWLGPHKLHDVDAGMSRFPYIPFFGYREDLTGIPYGLVRAMLSPQDEINARRRKLLWMLSSKVVQVDSDALDQRYNDFRNLIDEVARPDAVIITNPARKNPNGFTIGSNMEVSAQQYQVMQEAKQTLQEAAGVFQQMMGKTDSGVTAGRAIDSLIEQGTTTLAELTDNYRYSRRLVGEALLDLVSQDLSGVEVQVYVGEPGRRKAVMLNQLAVDPTTGVQYKKNDVKRAPVKVALSDIPSTPAYKQQMQVMLSEVMKSLPPNLQAIMAPYFLESTDLPKRAEMADAVRRMMGMQGPDGEQIDPQVAQMQAAMEELQAAMQQGAQEYEGQIAELTAKLQAITAKSASNDAAAIQKQQESERNAELERERIARETERANQDRALKLMEQQKKERELEIKEADAARAEQARIDQLNEAERQRKHEAEMARMQADAAQKAAELTAKAAEKSKAEEPKRDEGKEVAAIAKVVEQAVKPLIQKIEAIEKAESKKESSEKPAQALPPMTFNIQVDAKSEGKKTITLKKDKDGNTIGADVSEESSKKKADK